MLTYNSPVEEVLKLSQPCRCTKCENPCKFGSGVLADGDFEKIKNFLGLEDEEAKEYFEEIEKFNTKRLRPKILREKNKPYGKCIFYNKAKGCKIHPVKPLECKIAMGCKEYGEELIIWFNLNHFLNPKDIESLRQYKTYIESNGKILKGAEIENFLDDEKKKKLENYQDLIIQKDWEKELGLK